MTTHRFPTDGCPRCVHGYNPPIATRVDPDVDALTAVYRCESCGHVWRTAWGIAGLGWPDDRRLRATPPPGAHSSPGQWVSWCPIVAQVLADLATCGTPREELELIRGASLADWAP